MSDSASATFGDHKCKNPVGIFNTRMKVIINLLFPHKCNLISLIIQKLKFLMLLIDKGQNAVIVLIIINRTASTRISRWISAQKFAKRRRIFADISGDFLPLCVIQLCDQWRCKRSVCADDQQLDQLVDLTVTHSHGCQHSRNAAPNSTMPKKRAGRIFRCCQFCSDSMAKLINLQCNREVCLRVSRKNILHCPHKWIFLGGKQQYILNWS